MSRDICRMISLFGRQHRSRVRFDQDTTKFLLYRKSTYPVKYIVSFARRLCSEPYSMNSITYHNDNVSATDIDRDGVLRSLP